MANLKQLLRGAVAQVNPFDNGATFATVQRNQPPPKAPSSLIHQITHNGATNAAGSIINNISGLPSAFDAGRLAAAELTHNRPAIDNATVSLAKNLPRFFPIAATEAALPFGQDAATAAVAQFYGNNQANKAEQYAQHMLNNRTGNPVHDAAVDAYAGNVKTNLLNRELGTAGITMHTPKSTVIRKVGGHAATTALNAITAAKIPGVNEGSVMRDALTFGGLNAASGVAATAGQDNPTLLEYLKNGGAGFASGAALPVAVHAAAPAVTLARNLGVPRPTNLTDAELVSSARVLDARAGGSSTMDLTSEDARHFHNAQVKLGADPGTAQGFKAVSDALGAHRTFETRVQQRYQALKDAGQKAQDFAQKHPVGLGIQAVDEQGNPVSAFGKGKVYATDVNNVQHGFISDYADMLRGMEQSNKGGMLTPTNNVTGAPEYTRTSEHSPFYRQYYAENKKAPTKQAWFDEARKQIESGKAAFGASEDYKSLSAPAAVPDAQSGALTPYDTPAIIKMRAAQNNMVSTHTDMSPERQALREKVGQILHQQGGFADASKAPSHIAANRRADIVLGPPASGKTNIVSPLITEHSSRLIDSDEAKSLLGDVNQAGALHQESDHIVTDQMMQAAKRGDNIVLPLVGKNPERVKAAINSLKDQGYNVHLHYNHLDPELTAQRAVSRFNETGRFVDPNYVYNEVGLKSKITYDILKNHEGISSYKAYDNNVPRGEQPRLTEQGTNSRVRPEPAAPGRPLREPIAQRVAQLAAQEKVAGKSTEAVPAPKTNDALVSTKPINADQYIKEQTAAQKTAGSSKLSTLKRLRQELAIKGIDALAPIERPVENATGGRSQTLTLRNQLDRSLRSDTIASQYVKDNGLPKLIQSIKNTKAFDQYLLAKHGLDLTANGITTGRDAAKDTALVQQLSPVYEAKAKQLQAYSQKLLDKTVNYGLISKETAAYLKQKYPNYVPFDRIFTDEEMANQRSNGSGPASLSTQTVVQRIKGSERQIHSPLESILAKTHDVIAQGERNQAARAITDTMKLPNNPLQLKELKRGETIGNRPTVSFLDGGVKRVFETTPEVAQAAKSLNPVQLGLIGKILSYPTRLLRLGATGVNVGFTLANVTKDVASAFINSEHPLRASVANPKVFLESLLAATHHGGKQYAELVREGAGGTSFDIARNNVPATLKEIRAGRNVGSKALYTVTHPGELLRAVEDTIGRSEEFGRAMQYYGNKQAALKEGKSTAEATAYGADAARNNTVNFARAGEYGRVLNSVLPYFNAGLQGSRTLVRSLRDHPVQTSAKLAIASFMPVAATTAWNLSDPQRKAAYDDIQEYEKQGNIIIVPPNPKKDASGRWNVIKIPVSQEVANLNNIVRNGIEALQRNKGFNFAELAGNLTGTVTSLNTQSPRQVIGQLTPQGIKPAIEALTNQNLFTGNPIVPDNKKNLSPVDQYGKNTSGVAKLVGRGLNLSPYQIDNAIKTSLGGAGQNVVNTADRALAAIGAIPPTDVKGRSVEQSITNRFTSAQGQSEYAGVDKLIQSKMDELKKSSQYQAMNPDDKAKALTRLKNAVLKAGQNAFGIKSSSGSVPKATTREAGLLTGKTDVQSYLKNQTNGITKAPKLSTVSSNILDTYNGMDSQQRKAYLNDPKNEYQYNLAKFENDTKAGNLSDVQRFHQMQSLSKQKITSQYPRQVLDLYSLSKPELAAYLRTNKVSNETISQLTSLDQRVADSGTGKAKYAYGLTSTKRTSRGGTAKRGLPSRSHTLLQPSHRSNLRAMGRLSFKVPKLSARAPKLSKVRLKKVKALA